MWRYASFGAPRAPLGLQKPVLDVIGHNARLEQILSSVLDRREPVTEAEIEVFEVWFGDLLSRAARRSPRHAS